MRLLDKYSCIFCKYRKLNKNHDYACMKSWPKDEAGYPIGKCNSLSNIYYGKLINHFPTKQIDNFITERAYKKEEKYLKTMDKKYGNHTLETDDYKFIWGIKSYDDLSDSTANFYTMNDIDIIYDKNKRKYLLSIETAYNFNSEKDKKDYLMNLLNAFTKYMDDNNLIKYASYKFVESRNTFDVTANTIEELYAGFENLVENL